MSDNNNISLNNSWTEYSQYILMELKRLNKKLDSIELEVHSIKVNQTTANVILSEINDIKKEQAKLTLKINTMEVKSATYGTIGGIVVTVIGLLLQYIKN